jgi:hypothetical protein
MMSERKDTRRPSSRYWLIAKNEKLRNEVLTIDRDGKETLPVFSFREEAEMFLWLDGLEGGWRVKESRAGEIVSVLMGPHASAGHVALDPLPEMVAGKTLGLVSLDREGFLRGLLGEREYKGAHGRRDRLAVGSGGSRRVPSGRVSGIPAVG